MIKSENQLKREFRESWGILKWDIIILTVGIIK